MVPMSDIKRKKWEMSIIEKTQQTRNMRFFDEWSEYFFGYTPYKKPRKTEKGKWIDFDECSKYIFW